jgi:hypothetical protein
VDLSVTILRECIDLGSAGADGPNRGRLAKPFARGYISDYLRAVEAPTDPAEITIVEATPDKSAVVVRLHTRQHLKTVKPIER